ncbi:unknown protein [Seminavis robusta]|uniref:Uncharacterized protein n=1 Tax=Seminavis robusta TaxID=568900 RepID=A0A9N8HWY8_9STRA|nr:unknown protein [Seminavis robusta]|eukprot:Sro2340_g324000.1 n/a (111) ;mRNA; f:1551-1883
MKAASRRQQIESILALPPLQVNIPSLLDLAQKHMSPEEARRLQALVKEEEEREQEEAIEKAQERLEDATRAVKKAADPKKKTTKRKNPTKGKTATKKKRAATKKAPPKSK